MSHPPGRRHAAGFSLVELVIVMSVLAILLGIAIPNVQGFLVNYRASAQANDLIADIAYARGEAARLGRSTRVVASGTWAAGWIVGADLNGDGSVAGANEIFRQHGAIEQDFTMREGASLTTMTFGPSGQLTSPASGNVELALCQPTGYTKHRAVIVNPVGRAEIRKWSGSSFGTGTTVTCP